MRRPALFLLFLPIAANAQLLSDDDAKAQMKYDIQYLASDLLEGRETGTKGERMAAEYVRQKYAGIGLMPYGDSATYIQHFPFTAPPRVGEKSTLQIGRSILKLNEEWYPLSMSTGATIRTKLMKCGYGIEAPELGYNDYDGIDVSGWAAAISVGSPDGIHPHSKYLAHHDLRARIEKAVARGANAVVLYNNDATAEAPSAAMSAKSVAVGVPVVFVKGDLWKELMATGNPVAMVVDVVREQMTGMNMVGMIDNGKPNVVVIGAHMDHLGFGDEGSLHRGEPAIHNGADDNASGVAVLLQLARDLHERDDLRGNDYLFIAFSGEEKGLYGSNWWTKHPTIPIADITYMINLDMVGRLDTATLALAINGVGTSPAWNSLRPDTAAVKPPTKPRKPAATNDPEPLVLKLGESGVGPSDHTSFYLQGVPALHFFTGAHEDYHKPSDDEEKINYDGMLRVTRFIEQLILAKNNEPKLAFTKTAADSTEVPQFKVTLGVVPDYMYDGKGMRIDGVTDGKPAANAGLKTGDVVIQLGDRAVTDMMSYMKALGAFKKGDSTTVKVLRDGKEVVSDITF